MTAGVTVSGCEQAGELLLGSGDIVNLDTSVVAKASIPLSGHHHCVLQLDGTGPAANKDTELPVSCSNDTTLLWHDIIHSLLQLTI